MPPTQKRKARNPTGKGGFGERPQDINVGGAPRKGQSWAEVVKRITDMTRDEAMEYVGKNTRLGKLLKELPPKLPLKDAMVFASIVHYGREPNARMFQALTDREEGKPKEPTVGGDSEKNKIDIPAHMIAKDFTDVYRDIVNRGSTEYALDGGRGSSKSSFVALVSIMLLVNNPEWHMLAMRQVSDTLRKSVYSQLTWAISELGLDDKFKSTLNPMEIKYIPTGQTIYFAGASDPKNLKSIKPPFGYIALLWFEEYDQFAGEAAIRSIVQSALRGGDVAYRFETWNTPRSKNHWCNKYISIPKKGRYHLRTNYLTVPKEWLGKVFLDEAEFLKSVNLDAYNHEYIGDAVGIGGTVFENVQIRAITDEEIKHFETSCHGLDFGYFPDPAHYSQSHYNPAKRTLYIYGEVRKWKSSNKEMYNAMVEQGLTHNNLLICDREPKDIADLKKMGANARGAEKDAGSRNYSYKWLQRLAAIVIDNTRAPYTADEFLTCEMEQTKDGEYISSYPEKNDHAIDSVRYGTNLLWRQAGE
jgi:phage terminase large subunit